MTKYDDTQALVSHLVQLMKDSDLAELEVESEDLRVRLARVGSTPMVAAQPVPMAQMPAVDLASRPEPAGEASPTADAAADLSGAVVSPMVGTAYSSPDPSAPPFIRLGEKVDKGQTLLIIEAMKVMNPIKAPHAGTVSRILFENAQPVEFGQPLLVID